MTATATGGSAKITLASAEDFVNGDYLVVAGAGPATAQRTPSAPTVAAHEVSGSSTYSYKCMGFDLYEGLTAASAAGSVTHGPTVFGNLPVAISSMSRASDVVTVKFSSAIDAAAKEHIVISGDTSDLGFNGVWLIAAAPSRTQVTFKSKGSDGTGTGSSTGRLVNAYLITAISQSGTTVTVTTDVNHDIVVGTSRQPTFVIIGGVSPNTLNGMWTVSAVTANTFTFQSGYTATIKGTVGPSSMVTLFEYNEVSCPALTGSTLGFYVYGEDGTGTFTLIGKTLRSQRTFRDWGKYWRTAQGGFAAPSYIPTTPPRVAQSQLYVGQIVSGGGTVNLVMSANATSSVTGAVALHDDGQAILAAANAAASGGGAFKIPPATLKGGRYVINYPIRLPTHTDAIISGPIVVNETIDWSGGNNIQGRSGSSENTPQFGISNYIQITGLASPQFELRMNERLENLQFTVGDGQTAALFDGLGGFGYASSASFEDIRDCFFLSNGSSATSTPIVVQNGSSYRFRNLGVVAYSPLYSTGNLPTNQSPPIGGITFKGNDVNTISATAGQIFFDGINSINGRGVVVDSSYNSNYWGASWELRNIWDQQPITPGLLLWGHPNGNGPSHIMISNWLGDSSLGAVVGQIGGGASDVTITGSSTSGGMPLVTGNRIDGLHIFQASYLPLGQNTAFVELGMRYFNSGNTIGRERGEVQTFGVPVIFATAERQPWAFAYTTPSAPTAVPSGAGTIPAGSYRFAITLVGWNSGESSPSQYSAAVSLNGSQGVKVTPAPWPVSGVQGYNVLAYVNAGCGRMNSRLETGSSATITSYKYAYAGCPNYDGTGNPMADTNRLVAPELDLTQGQYKVAAAPTTLTASRTVTLPDGDSATVLVGALTTTAATSDNVAIQGVTSRSHCVLEPTNSGAAGGLASVYISAKTSNQITVTHRAIAGWTFDIICTLN